jgi:inner membrane protein
MDPLTQGVLGALAAQAFARPEKQRRALWVGALAGMAADLDVFISSSSDPLLALQFHRHFTHSLAFIPVGAALCAFVFWLGLRRRTALRRLYEFSFLGYATHALLDACTSYGTQLFWPFSDHRVAWSHIAVIDLLFTVPLLVLMGVGAWKRRRSLAWGAWVFAAAYMGFARFQKSRVEEAQASLAAGRGHTVERAFVHPTLGNLVLWRSLYVSGGQYYVDALRVGWGDGLRLYVGGSAPAIDAARDYPSLDPKSRLASDIERFSWFSEGCIARHPKDPDVLGDLRYATLPDSLEPLWGIRLNLAQPQWHAGFEHFRKVDAGAIARFRRMLAGSDLK